MRYPAFHAIRPMLAPLLLKTSVIDKMWGVKLLCPASIRHFSQRTRATDYGRVSIKRTDPAQARGLFTAKLRLAVRFVRRFHGMELAVVVSLLYIQYIHEIAIRSYQSALVSRKRARQQRIWQAQYPLGGTRAGFDGIAHLAS